MTEREQHIEQVEHNLTILLRRARSIIVQSAKQLHPDLEPEAYGLLVRIHELDKVKASDIATYFGIGRPTMSRQLAALEKLGLIERSQATDDARSQVIELTPEGRERLSTVRDASRTRFRQRLESWSDDDISAMAGLLHKINEDI